MAVPAARVEEAGAKGRARRYSPHSNRKRRWPLASNVPRAAMLTGAMPRLAEPDPVLRQWPQTERPTYRAIQCGPESLTDAELISVLLRTGIGGESAIDTARRLIQEGGSLLAAVTKASNLTDEQSARLAASLELARRVLRENIRRAVMLSSPAAVRDYLRLKLQDRPHEVFVCVYLDAQNRVIADEELFRGTLTQTSVYPREVVKRALHHNAAALILAHNHPSGIAEPSRADELQLHDTRLILHAFGEIGISREDVPLILKILVSAVQFRPWPPFPRALSRPLSAGP